MRLRALCRQPMELAASLHNCLYAVSDPVNETVPAAASRRICSSTQLDGSRASRHKWQGNHHLRSAWVWKNDVTLGVDFE